MTWLFGITQTKQITLTQTSQSCLKNAHFKANEQFNKYIIFLGVLYFCQLFMLFSTGIFEQILCVCNPVFFFTWKSIPETACFSRNITAFCVLFIEFFSQTHVRDKNIDGLSGWESQWLACSVSFIQPTDPHMRKDVR